MDKKKKKPVVTLSQVLAPLADALKKGHEESGKPISEYAPDVGLSHVTFSLIQNRTINNITVTKVIDVAACLDLDVVMTFKARKPKK